MPREKRRGRSPHPGVWIVRCRWTVKGKGPDRGRTWKGVAYRGKWVDPDSGRWERLTLDEATYPTKDSRLLWARDKSEALAKRRAELLSGCSRAGRIGLGAAIGEFLDTSRAQLRPRTIEGYKMALGFLGRWAERVGVKNASDLTPAMLARFADAVKSGDALKPKRTTRRSPRRGRPPSATYCNNVHRAIGTFCKWLRRRSYAPTLHRDLVAEALETVPTETRLPRPLAHGECASLLGAALRHDFATFKKTRAEHEASPSTEEVARTPRHRPIAAFVAFVLISGCRAGEARELKWGDVDLDAPGQDGIPTGEIRLLASAVKTKKERRVDLMVSPALRSILSAMKLRSDGAEYVFGGAKPLSSTVLIRARRRLEKRYGAPEFTLQRIRQTTASYLWNAGEIFGNAGHYLAAEQLGHAPDVARRLYVGLIKNIPRGARTLEAAMRIEEQLELLKQRIVRGGGAIVRPARAPKQKSA